jgi:MFS family permease
MTHEAQTTWDVPAIQRRTLVVLVSSQALGGLGNLVGIAVAAVLAQRVSGSDALAGMMQTFQVLGAAASSFFLARIMGARGRRAGLTTGYAVGAVGSGIVVVGGALGSFPVLLLGALLLGTTSATNLQARYAAADLAAPDRRARAVGLVLWSTTFGAVLGPNLVGPAGRLAEALGLPRLTGPFLLSVVIVSIAAVVVWLALRPDPLLVAKAVARLEAGEVRVATAAPPKGAFARVRELVGEHPGILAGILAMATSQAVMVAIMAMTPLHMDHGGASLEIIGFVISIHVLGMFFFSPVVGVVADRVGRPQVLVAGAVLFVAALWLAGSSPMGASTRIGVGLFLLGLAWSCGTVAASALVTESTPLEDRTTVQGVADVVMNVAAGTAALLGGVVVDWLGFAWLNGLSGILLVGLVASIALASREPRLRVSP